jgi:hypothetical protein
MDIDEPSPYLGVTASPMSVARGTPRKRVNGGHAEVHNNAPTPRLKQLPVSAGLTVSSRPRPALADDEIDRMLERAVAAAAEESDSDGEIELPAPRAGARRDGAGVVG